MGANGQKSLAPLGHKRLPCIDWWVERHVRKMICALNASSMPCVCRWKGYNAVAQTVFVERITGNLQKLPFQPSLPASLSLEHGAKVFLCRNECKVSNFFCRLNASNYTDERKIWTNMNFIQASHTSYILLHSGEKSSNWQEYWVWQLHLCFSLHHFYSFSQHLSLFAVE